MPAHHLLEPYDGEIFEDTDAAFNRYQDYAFSKGFFIVILSSSNETALRPHCTFSCKHYSMYTRNYRKLDDFHGKNSNRQREATKVHQKNCGWCIWVAWKKLPGHVGDIKRWVATIRHAKHSNPDTPEAPEHDFVANPLAYIGHKDRLPEAKEAAAAAYALRATRETYLTAQRQLSARELHISKKKYYSLTRSLSGLPSGAEGQPRALGALELLLY